jgi:ATP-dependent RNA helicase HelY
MLKTKSTYRRPGKTAQRRRHSPVRKGFCEDPRLDPQLKQTFRRIGVPEPTPFRPDPFQTEALEKIRHSDVLVSAPTGSGKTWIASQAISEYLSRGLKTWYASPLKALSNSIYQQFCQEFGRKECGILTGDRKENPDAPIIVGTTEILRNQLYDAMNEGIRIGADLVILDEAHYLSDPERGVVWEEVLIYLPSRVRLLLLSATISNGEEICSWLEENRGMGATVVRSHERPVPLELLFLFPDGLISPLAGRKGLVPRVKKFVASHGGRGRRRGSGRLHYGDIIKCLRAFDLLPAIFFLKSRMDCDQALTSCASSGKTIEEKGRVRREVKTFLKKYPHLEGNRQMRPLLEAMVGSHHAGQLPYWKMLVEKMMNKGCLEAIFSTSTVAAGVNFPARTVVMVQSDRYNGREFSDLTATELHQMTGRAGRRGKDNIGFALLVPGMYQDPQLIYELRDSPPEPLMSQIHINFSMTLNLLLSHTPGEVKDLLERSFASFQERKSAPEIRRRGEEMLAALRRVIPGGKCDIMDPYEVWEYIQKRSEWQREERRLAREVRNKRVLDVYREYLSPGRVFLHKNGDIYVVFHTYTDKGRFISAAHNIKRAVRLRKKRPRLKKVAFTHIKALFNLRVDLPEDPSPEGLQAFFHGIEEEDLEILHLDIPGEKEGTAALEEVRTRLNELPCDDCPHFGVCHSGKSKELKKILRDFRSVVDTMEGMGGGLWLSFKRHLRFLKETGFVDEGDQLTPDGSWASKLRLDQPLLIAEAIRKGAFSGLSPEVMAGCIAPFVWDRDQDVEFRIETPLDLKGMEKSFYRVLSIIEGISMLKAARGFENPQILFWPAAALYLWAKGVPWEQVMSFIPVNDGDMASLIMRTADHLRQVANLEETHPELASTARTAVDLIMREPVFIE